MFDSLIFIVVLLNPGIYWLFVFGWVFYCNACDFVGFIRGFWRIKFVRYFFFLFFLILEFCLTVVLLLNFRGT